MRLNLGKTLRDRDISISLTGLKGKEFTKEVEIPSLNTWKSSHMSIGEVVKELQKLNQDAIITLYKRGNYQYDLN